MNFTQLGENIRKKRTERNMTQETLSELADISSVFLSQIENAHKVPSLETVFHIAEGLNVPLESLFRENSMETDRIEQKFSQILEGKTKQEKEFLLDILNYIAWKMTKDKIES
jgi:transcriptional regulator with XRE-family HTH domain